MRGALLLGARCLVLGAGACLLVLALVAWCSVLGAWLVDARCCVLGALCDRMSVGFGARKPVFASVRGIRCSVFGSVGCLLVFAAVDRCSVLGAWCGRVIVDCGAPILVFGVRCAVWRLRLGLEVDT